MSARRIVRFTGVERFVHLLTLVAFVTLAGTGAILFLPQLGPWAAGEGGQLNRVVHRIAAVLLVLSPVLYLVLDARNFGGSVRRMLTWRRTDLAWFATALKYYWTGNRAGIPPQDKFNSGQKLNALLQTIALVVFTVTGALMWLWPAALSASAFRWSIVLHDVAFVVAMGAFLLHLYLVLFHPLTRQHVNSMVDGTIDEESAAALYPVWYREARRGR